MPYCRHRAALGDVASTLVTAAAVAGDPYFSEAVCHVGQLKAITAKLPVPRCGKTAPGLVGGVGLGRAMPAMRAYVYAEQQPWVYYAGAAAIVGVPMLVGYLLGKGL